LVGTVAVLQPANTATAKSPLLISIEFINKTAQLFQKIENI